MSEKKSKSERLYDLVEKRTVVRKVRDPLDEVIEEEERELAREAKRLRLQEIIERRKREIEKLKEESKEKSKGESEVLSGVSPAMAAELAKLPEEQRKAVIETYAMLKAAEKGKAGMELLLPLLIGFVKANPQAKQPDLVEYAKVVNEQLKTAMQLVESKKEKEKEKKVEAAWNPVELIKTFGDIIAEKIEKPFQELIQRVQPAPSPFERILMDDKLFERAKALGMFSGGVQTEQKTPPEVLVEVEKLRTEREMAIEKMRQEREMRLQEMQLQHQRWLAEQQLEQRKWEQIGKLFEGPIGKTIQTIGAGAARKISGYGGQQVSVTQVTCPTCKKQFPAFADAERVICPYCNAVLVKTGGEEGESAERAAKEEEAKPKQKSKRK